MAEARLQEVAGDVESTYPGDEITPLVSVPAIDHDFSCKSSLTLRSAPAPGSTPRLVSTPQVCGPTVLVHGAFAYFKNKRQDVLVQVPFIEPMNPTERKLMIAVQVRTAVPPM